MEKIGTRQNKKLYVAITGGIGSGKSTVCDILRSLGYEVYSADQISHELYKDENIQEKIKNNFTQCIVEGEIDRKILSEIVFSDQSKKRKLEKIFHPKVIQRLKKRMSESHGKIIFAEIPLLFEGGFENEFDRVIVVIRPLKDRIKSVMERDGLSEQEVMARIKNQYNYEENSFSAHSIVYNQGDKEFIQQQVLKILDAKFNV